MKAVDYNEIDEIHYEHLQIQIDMLKHDIKVFRIWSAIISIFIIILMFIKP